ncbi:BadF/BadG/BcrA/BcrD ATPase family protein [Streptomyces tunisiensis]|uniref:BadF/BadG/BcrA/BcrD ATPase family protein n=1 Tax=Streptomyces tunisiensis TaxID=948699 RepID=UPI00403DD10C
MGLTAAVLAVDAGNSKTDVAVVAPDGTVLATARGDGFRPPADGLDKAMEALSRTVKEALSAAGAPTAAHISACLANADLPIEEEELTEAIASRHWSSTVTVRNDTFAILRAGVPEPRGVAVVCGAGINCVGMRPDGRTARFPALGRFSGDWGGGWALAEEALWHAARAADGRGEPTALATALPAHYGVPDMPALIEALHLDRIPLRRRHEATPVLFATAAQGDAVARGVVDHQAAEIVTMATVALTRLDLLDEETPVCLGGSVLAADHPVLTEGIRTKLQAAAPKAEPHIVTARPVLGAALLGLDDMEAPPEAQERLRAHYT